MPKNTVFLKFLAARGFGNPANRAIAARGHIAHGNELKCCRIDAVAQARRGRPVVKDMAQMAVSMA